MTTPTTRFRDLAIGQTFDFVDDSRPGFNSFYSRCMKTSTRMYATQDHPTLRYRVGTINVPVFHVEGAERIAANRAAFDAMQAQS